MGGALKTAGGGLNSLMSPFGLGGEQGDYFHANNTNPALAQYNQYNAGLNDGGIPQQMNEYAQGNISSADLAKMFSGKDTQEQMAMQNQLATGANTGSKYATEQVQNNPILGQLFGQGGSLSRAIGQESQLQNQGYALTPEDHTAYGQASGNIARLFGTQEQGAAQSLADRGLGAAPSGAAGIAFSGLQGNKNEALAKAQTDIANQRMQNTMGRIAQQQQFISSLGGQAANDIQSQYGRQLSGAQNYTGNLAQAAGLNTQQNQAANSANEAQMTSEQKAAGKTLFGAFGNGLYSGVGAASGSGMAGMMGAPQKDSSSTTDTSSSKGTASVGQIAASAATKAG